MQRAEVQGARPEKAEAKVEVEAVEGAEKAEVKVKVEVEVERAEGVEEVERS